MIHFVELPHQSFSLFQQLERAMILLLNGENGMGFEFLSAASSTKVTL